MYSQQEIGVDPLIEIEMYEEDESQDIDFVGWTICIIRVLGWDTTSVGDQLRQNYTPFRFKTWTQNRNYIISDIIVGHNTMFQSRIQ